MILTRIARGAVRTSVLINNKISRYGKPTFTSASQVVLRLRRPASLSLLAAYTATIPLHALQGSVALADETEPPSTIAVQHVNVDALTAVSLTGVEGGYLQPMQSVKVVIPSAKSRKS